MTDPRATDMAVEPPTRVRHLVVAVTMMMSVLLYLDRVCVSSVATFISEDLGLASSQMGTVLGSFFWAYGLAQVPTGWLSDRYGARLMLSAYVLLWSLFTGLTGLATGFVMLLVLRLGFGVGQAGGYPTAGGVISRWVPINSRGKASGIVAFGGRLGGFLAPILTPLLIVGFVPFEKPSRLTALDILDVDYLAKQLQQPGEAIKPISQRVWWRFSSELQTAIEASSDHVASDHADLKGPLANGLNSLMGDREFYDAKLFASLSLPKQAQDVLKLSPADRTPHQVERLNRLVLEAAYPLGIRKVYVAGWRQVFMVYGAVGVLVAGLIWLLVRNDPRQHPACNAAEAALIEHGKPAHATHSTSLPLGPLVKSRSMWLSSISQAGTNIGWVFLITWLPRYLEEVHRVPIETRGVMQALPLFVGWFGMLMGGPLTDVMVRRYGLRWGRALPMGLTRFGGMAAFLVCLLPLSGWVGSYWTPWILTAAFALVAFATDLGVAAVWAFCQDVGGRRVGSVLGWGNMWGNFGAAISPNLLDWAIGKHANWDLAFSICAVSFLISGIAALGIDATRPIVPDDESAARQ